MKQEIYTSSTMGDIPLSFTGRRLLQNLREEIGDYVNSTSGMDANSWKPLSIARGKIAQYISKLEQARPDISAVPDAILLGEIERRFTKARMVEDLL